MLVKRIGRCDTCYAPTNEKRDFPETVNIFGEEVKSVIASDLVKQIEEWRNQPLNCEDHRDE